MREELDKKLVQSFPNLYRDRYGDMRTTCMCWGFPGDGWFSLLWDASEKLEAEILKLKKENPEDEDLPVAVQVKEKFGTLRFYMSSYTEEIHNIIQEAEKRSAVTCEECGAPGKLYGGGWLLTLCEKHAKEKGRTHTAKEWMDELEKRRSQSKEAK